MPLFEYKCLDCGQEFEELVFGDKTPPCPKCESTKTEKKFSAFATSGSSSVSGGHAPSCNTFS